LPAWSGIQQNISNVPIGTFLPWPKNFPGVPALSATFAECNGQVLNDPLSPLHGQILPNLNGAGGGTKRFLRGSITSGTTGGTETHTHTIFGTGVYWGSAGSATGTDSGASSTLPSYYEVVWIICVRSS
jgi:hypothetical protein